MCFVRLLKEKDLNGNGIELTMWRIWIQLDVEEEDSSGFWQSISIFWWFEIVAIGRDKRGWKRKLSN